MATSPYVTHEEAETQRDEVTYTDLPVNEQQSQASDADLIPRSVELYYTLVQSGPLSWYVYPSNPPTPVTSCSVLLVVYFHVLGL